VRRPALGPGAFGRLRRLAWPDRLLLIRAALLLAAFRLGLKLLPFTILERISASTRPRSPKTPPPVEARLAWAITAAGRRVPGASCLTQALTMQYMLSRRGRPSRLLIGVVKSSDGQFQAHAWVESDGRTIIGGPATERYARLAAFGQVAR
jgi:hypothetical protein